MLNWGCVELRGVLNSGGVELRGVLNSAGVQLRGVLNWGVFGVKLRDFGCWKGVVFVLNWCVELRGVLNWRVFWFELRGVLKSGVLNWAGVQLRGVLNSEGSWTEGCVKLRGCRTEGFLVLNWGILGAGKVWSLSWTNVMNSGGLCGTEGFSQLACE